MKKIFFSLVLFLAVGLSVSAAETKAAPAAEKGKTSDKWTFFQVGFLPGLPSAQMNSTVYGVKTGWPLTTGYGTVFGIEASWAFSGTNHIKGIQGSWVGCYNREADGIQAAFFFVINRQLMRGIQAAMGYSHAGDVMGIQAGGVSLADDVYGLQGAFVYAQGKAVKGFQAAAVCVDTGKLSGVQCSVYGQVGDSNGVQLGVVNVSHGKGFQFGLINYMKNGFLPVFPLINFAF